MRRTLLLLTLAFAACEKAFPVDGRDAAGSGGAADVGRVVDVDAARGNGEAEKDEASTGDGGRDDAKASEADAHEGVDATGPADDAAGVRDAVAEDARATDAAPMTDAQPGTNPDAQPGPSDAQPGASDAQPRADAQPLPDAATPDAAPRADAAVDAGTNPCGNVSCAQVPPPTCVGATTLRTFSGPGACSQGQCGFASVDTNCPDACSQGACVALSCGAARCDRPPAQLCVDASVLRRFAPIGSCDAATASCRYDTTDSICLDGCAGAACAPGSWSATRIAVGATFPAIALDPLDRPHVVYFRNNDVEVATRTSRGWSSVVVDRNLTPSPTYIAADRSGGVHVVYAERANANARYAYRAFGASTFTVEFVASAGVVVPYGLALDAAGVPVVAYTVGNTLHVARRTAPGVWTTTHSAPLGNPLRAAFLTLGPSDEPYVAVSTMTVMGTTARLDVAQAGLPTASSWTFEPLVAQEVTGVVRRATGELDVSVVSNTRDLRVHTRAPQGGWSVETVQFDVIANVLRANRQGDVRSVYYFNRTGFVDRGLVVSSPDPVNGWMREHEVRQSLGVGRESLDGAVGSSGAWYLVGDVSPGGELYVFER